MIDFRLYRIAWLPALAAFVTMMFSLEGIPAPFEPAVAPAEFDADRVKANARQVLSTAPEREAGSEGDAAVADLVLERFRQIDAGTAGEQPFTAELDGTETELRNVLLTLPGESDRVVLVVAGRDANDGAGAASSAAATAALLELAEVMGGAEHSKTLVFVSTAAAAEGAVGVRRFLESFGSLEPIEAAIVIAQPGSRDPRPPYVLRRSLDDSSTSIQLVRTAEAAIADRAGRPAEDARTLQDLARLAMPVAAGEHAALIAEGVDAIAISSAGERPLPPSQDTEEHLDTDVLSEFGSAVLGTLLAVDQSLLPLEHGPDAYVEFSGSLVPGWAIGVLALALLMPAAVAAFDAVARSARRRSGTGHALAWAGGLAAPLLGALILLYLLSGLGIVIQPAYPFDPARFDAGFGEVLLFLLLATAALAGYLLAGLSRLPQGARREALAPALGAAAVAGALVSWVVNPYLALLLVPAAHAWVLAAGRPRSRALLLVAALLALLPLVLASRSALGAIGGGAWDVIVMVTGGHISALSLIALCPVLGSLAGLVILASRPGGDRTGRLGSGPQAAGVPSGADTAEASIEPASPVADTEGKRESHSWRR